MEAHVNYIVFLVLCHLFVSRFPLEVFPLIDKVVFSVETAWFGEPEIYLYIRVAHHVR